AGIDVMTCQLGAVVAQPADPSRLGDHEVEGADHAELLGGDRVAALGGSEQRQRAAASRRLVGQPGRLDPVEDHRDPPRLRIHRQPGPARLDVDSPDQARVPLGPPFSRRLPSARPELVAGRGEQDRPLGLGVEREDQGAHRPQAGYAGVTPAAANSISAHECGASKRPYLFPRAASEARKVMKREVRIRDTLSGELVKLDPGREVGIYACGPTVYSRIHIGNARPFVVFSLLARFLRSEGYSTRLVVNVTNINDKIYAAAAEAGEPSAEFAARMTAAYMEDTGQLGLGRPDAEPLASETLDGIVALIAELVEG